MTSPNTPKWIPKHNVETKKLFDLSKQLDREMRFLCCRFSHQDVNMDMPDVFEFDELIAQTRQCFEMSGKLQVNLQRLTGTASANKNFERSPYKVLQSRKAVLLRQNLKRHHFQLIFQLQNMMCTMLTSCAHTELVIDASLKICSLLNETVEFISTKNIHKAGGAQICSNTFPTIMSLPKKIDVGIILQIVCKQRSEQCCLQLITCLIAGYRSEMMTPNQESDTSSVEILRTITHNLQSPVNGILPVKSVSMTAKPKLETVSLEDDPTINFFDNLVNQFHNQQQQGGTTYDGIELLHRLVHEEENFMANIMIKCLQICPTVFDKQLSREDLVKWINRGSRSLWTQVGGTLDHVLLWWSNAPVASQPTSHAKYLRDWLLILQPDDAPEPILSTLKRLGESLTMHVTNTTWDRQFSAAIVTAGTMPVDISLENCPYKPDHSTDLTRTKSQFSSTCGLLWGDVLKSLVKLANSCDCGGTIPNELPIVEQIPILHRLDHSIHSMRLWAAEQSKALCSQWNMLMFFKVVLWDIGVCLEHLADLRVPQMVPPGPLDVHVQVCVSLRAKLVSEIKINIEKLKKQTAECIDILSSVCMTCSLATLSLCFPVARIWQCDVVQTAANDYVKYFLDQIYLPVLESGVQDLEILGLILKIMCEAWLDHIYASRTKFSRSGALNLLKDFDGVAEYIKSCPAVPAQHVEKLAKHEVLRMCEGVGRILLRKPEDLIQMAPENVRSSIVATTTKGTSDKFADGERMDERPQLPPEMFVPNQKRWLELRAKDRSAFAHLLCLCGANDVVVVPSNLLF